MRVKTIGTVILLFILSFSYSQKTKQEERMKYYRLAIGISPSSFINQVQGLQFSIDAKINDYFNFSSELGYLFNSRYSYNVYGYRFRPSFEIMLLRTSDVAIQLGGFALFRNFYEERKAVVRHENYTQLIPVVRQKNLQGGGLAFAIIGKLSERINIETGFGLGNGKLIISDSEDIDGRISSWSIFVYDSLGETSMPIVYINFNVSYALIK